MAWEARSGLKLRFRRSSLALMCGLNGLGSPFGFETSLCEGLYLVPFERLNGLGSPFGFETFQSATYV